MRLDGQGGEQDGEAFDARSRQLLGRLDRDIDIGQRLLEVSRRIAALLESTVDSR